MVKRFFTIYTRVKKFSLTLRSYFFTITIMAVIKLTKSANGLKTWKRLASDAKRREKQEFCAFYTPAGRMVSKPAGKRPRHMHPEEWCAAKTPFKGKVIKSY